MALVVSCCTRAAVMVIGSAGGPSVGCGESGRDATIGDLVNDVEALGHLADDRVVGRQRGVLVDQEELAAGLATGRLGHRDRARGVGCQTGLVGLGQVLVGGGVAGVRPNRCRSGRRTAARTCPSVVSRWHMVLSK